MDEQLVELDRDPVVEAFKKDVDRSLLRRHLQLTPEQRIQLLIDLQEFAEELPRAGKAVPPGARTSDLLALKHSPHDGSTDR